MVRILSIDDQHVRWLMLGSSSKWITELSDQLQSTARLDAFDISALQYPPQQWLPDNISLRVQDAFLPFPEDAVGKYDIVHVQLFISLIKANDPSSLIKNLMSLLSK